MKSLTLKILYVLQFHRLTRYILRDHVIILMYHGFTDKSKFDGIINYHGENIYIDFFEKHLQVLKKKYNVISLERFIDAINNNSDLPPYSAVITMDDGYRSNYKLAFQLLKKYKMPATIFVTTGFIDENKPLWTERIEYALSATQKKKLKIKIDDREYDFDLSNRNLKIECDKSLKLALKEVNQKDRDRIIDEIENCLEQKLKLDGVEDGIFQPLRWDEISEMLESGLVTIGSHTHSHFTLARIDDVTADYEIALSKNLIEERTQKKCVFFSYPNGKPSDYGARDIVLLKKHVYLCAFTTVFGFAKKGDDLYQLQRIGVKGTESYAEFIMRVSGAIKILGDWKRAIFGKR